MAEKIFTTVPRGIPKLGLSGMSVSKRTRQAQIDAAMLDLQLEGCSRADLENVSGKAAEPYDFLFVNSNGEYNLEDPSNFLNLCGEPSIQSQSTRQHVNDDPKNVKADSSSRPLITTRDAAIWGYDMPSRPLTAPRFIGFRKPRIHIAEKLAFAREETSEDRPQMFIKSLSARGSTPKKPMASDLLPAIDAAPQLNSTFQTDIESDSLVHIKECGLGEEMKTAGIIVEVRSTDNLRNDSLVAANPAMLQILCETAVSLDDLKSEAICHEDGPLPQNLDKAPKNFHLPSAKGTNEPMRHNLRPSTAVTGNPGNIEKFRHKRAESAGISTPEEVPLILISSITPTVKPSPISLSSNTLKGGHRTGSKQSQKDQGPLGLKSELKKHYAASPSEEGSNIRMASQNENEGDHLTEKGPSDSEADNTYNQATSRKDPAEPLLDGTSFKARASPTTHRRPFSALRPWSGKTKRETVTADHAIFQEPADTKIGTSHSKREVSRRTDFNNKSTSSSPRKMSSKDTDNARARSPNNAKSKGRKIASAKPVDAYKEHVHASNEQYVSGAGIYSDDDEDELLLADGEETPTNQRVLCPHCGLIFHNDKDSSSRDLLDHGVGTDSPRIILNYINTNGTSGQENVPAKLIGTALETAEQRLAAVIHAETMCAIEDAECAIAVGVLDDIVDMLQATFEGISALTSQNIGLPSAKMMHSKVEDFRHADCNVQSKEVEIDELKMRIKELESELTNLDIPTVSAHVMEIWENSKKTLPSKERAAIDALAYAVAHQTRELTLSKAAAQALMQEAAEIRSVKEVNDIKELEAMQREAIIQQKEMILGTRETELNQRWKALTAELELTVGNEKFERSVLMRELRLSMVENEVLKKRCTMLEHSSSQ